MATHSIDDHLLYAAGVQERRELPMKTPKHPTMTQRDYEAWVSRLKVISLGLAVLALVAVSLGLAYYRG